MIASIAVVTATLSAGAPRALLPERGPGAPASAYPRVFIVPLGHEFTHDLTNCAHKPGGETFPASWLEEGSWNFRAWRAARGLDERGYFAASTARQPYGAPRTVTLSPTSSYAATDMPTVVQGEYDLDVYFHSAVRGYARRVRDPEQADLFYVPAYAYWRLACHREATSAAALRALETRLADTVAGWMARYPPPAGAEGPNFFSATGMLCSCALSHCNPLDARADLDGKLRVLSYDMLPRAGPAANLRSASAATKGGSLMDARAGRAYRVERGVVPYLAQLHDVARWDVSERRPTLSLFLGTEKAERACVSCGPCGCPCEGHCAGGCALTVNSWCNRRRPEENETKMSASHVTTSTASCSAGCLNLRPSIAQQARRHAQLGSTGEGGGPALLWPDGEITSQGSLANATTQYARMLTSTFCLQPPGDTLTRKSFYESILTGCIPVVFRTDAEFVEQLAYPTTVPYDEMWLALPHTELLAGNLDIVHVLSAVTPREIAAKRRAMRAHGRRVAFAATDAADGGFNDFAHPDAFLTSLQEAWDAMRPPGAPRPAEAAEAAGLAAGLMATVAEAARAAASAITAALAGAPVSPGAPANGGAVPQPPDKAVALKAAAAPHGRAAAAAALAGGAAVGPADGGAAVRSVFDPAHRMPQPPYMVYKPSLALLRQEGHFMCSAALGWPRALRGGAPVNDSLWVMATHADGMHQVCLVGNGWGSRAPDVAALLMAGLERRVTSHATSIAEEIAISRAVLADDVANGEPVLMVPASPEEIAISAAAERHRRVRTLASAARAPRARASVLHARGADDPEAPPLALDDARQPVPDFHRPVRISLADMVVAPRTAAEQRALDDTPTMAFACIGPAADSCGAALIPQSSYVDYLEVGLGAYDDMAERLSERGQLPPAAHVCGWLGNPNGVAQRERFMKLLDAHPSLLEGAHRDELGGTEGAVTLEDQVARWSCLLDLRGIGWSARLPLLFASGRVVLRTPPNASKVWTFLEDPAFLPEDPLTPWTHYVPIADDLSDLADRARWVQQHADEAAAIGRAGRAWAQTHLGRRRVEDYLAAALVRVAVEDAADELDGGDDGDEDDEEYDEDEDE